jgi:hypothetical protein
MNLDKDVYTKQEVEEMLNPLNKEINDLKGIVAEGNKAIEKVKELEKANLDNAIKLELTKSGLNPDDVYDLVSADSLEKAQVKINKLIELKKQNKLDNSFKPEDKKKQSDEYSHAEKTGNVEGMLKSKLSKIFQ